MSRHTGHIELDRTVDSIIVGNRHRADLIETALRRLSDAQRDPSKMVEVTKADLEAKAIQALSLIHI